MEITGSISVCVCFSHLSINVCSVLKEMLGDVRKHVGCLYRLTECVSMLDMLHSFAHLCTISDYSMSGKVGLMLCDSLKWGRIF